MKMPAVTQAQHSFSRVPSVRLQRSSFDRSHGHKTTFDAGYLIPMFVDWVLPGDTLKVDMRAFLRLATPFKPIMDNLHVETFFFAVPYRLLWVNFEKFMGAQEPSTFTAFILPTISNPAGGWVAGTLGNYFGLPTVNSAINVQALPFRAYNLIYNQWFRDENLQTSIVVDTDDGPDTVADYVLRKRGKRHDYFTSCLPFAQKGTAVSLPLGTQAPIKGIGWDAMNTAPTANVTNVKETSPLPTRTYPFGQFIFDGTSWGTGNLWIETDTGVAGTAKPLIYADLTQATAATISQLRQAVQVQKLLESDARGGTRYIERVKQEFGVTSDDARMQRAEYLGGGRGQIMVSPVAQTAPQQAAGVVTPQGNLAAIGTGSFGGHGFVKSFTEHCIVMGLICVYADLTYQQGMERHWKHSTPYDMYRPALDSIGEQAVLNREIYAQGDGNPNDVLVFGYQERYAEYRYKPSRITGKFNGTDPTPLDVWHLAQEFGALPTLNATFIEEDPPVDRVITVPTEPHFLCDSWFSYVCARPMPTFSIPGGKLGF